MGEAQAATPKYNETTRVQFGGDFRMRAALRRPDGSMVRMQQKTLIPSGPGDIIHRANPALEFAVSAVELSNAPAAATQRLQLLDDGYRFCIWGEWDLSERYRNIWEEGADGKIVTDAGGGYGLALMWCPRELVEKRHDSYRAWSDEVEKTFEQRMEETMGEFDAVAGQHGLNSARNRERAIERHLEAQDRLTKLR